jgi:hypothetical protein
MKMTDHGFGIGMEFRMAVMKQLAAKRAYDGAVLSSVTYDI